MNEKDPIKDTEIQEPDFSGEKMKMPENSELKSKTVTKNTESSIVGAPLLIILGFLLIAILSGMYYWLTVMSGGSIMEPTSATTEQPVAIPNNEPESTGARAQADAMLVTSPSDELSAIEADLEATNFDTLDTELNAIDTEINSAVTTQ